VNAKNIYFVAGEASGDNHGAALMLALQEREPTLQFTGRGGPQMKSVAGDSFENWIGDAAVLGLWEVLKKYGYFRAKFRQTLSDITRLSPDAVVLIDYPGFNLRLAAALHRQKNPRKIIYYISPQVWAWHRGRIARMARCIDLMLCIFPFEADLYNRSGLRTRFVGHPMIDRLASQKTGEPRQPDRVGLFPGSREREVQKIFPILIRVMAKLNSHHPDMRFEVAAASPALAKIIEGMIAEAKLTTATIRIESGNAAALMQRAAVGIVASGSATLEAAYFRLPFVLVYKVAWLTYLAARMLVQVKYLGMPNLLAGKNFVPEFIQHGADPDAIATAVLELFDNQSARDRMVREFDGIMAQLGDRGASQSAAREILNELDATS
jgi:lipid-A-disaccharide synthase